MRHVWVALAVALAAPAWASPEKDAASHYSAGQKAFEAGDFALAAEQLKASTEAKPTVKALLMLGNTYIRLGQLDEAKAAFERILVVDPHSSKRKTVEGLIRDIDHLARTKLVVASTPPGATVYLDLKAEGVRGKTPLTLPATPGRHRVILELEGHESLGVEATAVEGQDVPVNATMRIRGCDVSVTTTPAHVMVRVDGGEARPTPATLRVPLGEHRLDLSGDGLAPRGRALVCEERGLAVAETLEPLPIGVLSVRAPDGARIAVDGKSVTLAEAARLALPPGKHEVALEADGKVPWRTTVVLQQGDRVEVAPRLDAPLVEKRPTALQITADPPDAEIRVNSKRVVARELVLVDPGHDEVEVRARGHNPYWRLLDLHEGETIRVDTRLQPRGRAALIVGTVFLSLGLGAEAVALAGHFSADREFTGSANYNTWHDVELGGHITAGILGGIALISYIAGIGQVTTEGAVERKGVDVRAGGSRSYAATRF
jgi:hypothetical protein